MAYRVRKMVCDFAYAHVLPPPYEGSCSTLHGHNGQVFVTLESHSLNEHGMVCDFKDLKETMGAYVKENLDHSLIWSGDNYKHNGNPPEGRTARRVFPLALKTSTVENIAYTLYHAFAALLEDLKEAGKCSQGCRLLEVSVEETNGSAASYTPFAD